METRFSSRNRVISEYIVVIYLVSRPKKKKQQQQQQKQEFPRPSMRMTNFPLSARL